MSKCEFRKMPNLDEARQTVPCYKTISYSDNIGPLLSSFAQGKHFFVKTYGCQGNIRDGEVIKGILSNDGFTEVSTEKEADLIIINTCAVRENAEDKVFGEIGNLKALKVQNKNLIIAICGCMIMQPSIDEKIIDKYPHVDLLFGTNDIYDLNSMIEDVLKKRRRLVNVTSKSDLIYEDLPSVRENGHKAFVNIMYGCNKFCTYCIVPYTRGRERSRSKEGIIKECQDLVNQGYKEITLLGQNVNSYGKDLKNNYNFANLLEDVAKTGIPRLRFTTSHPWDFSEQMIDVIAKYPNIMKCIHLPVQSGNTNILRLMGRRYNREDYLNLIKMIRSKAPNIALSTDIIVGFPNETYEEFLDTVSLVKEVKYDSAFSFIYSPRKGTPAARIEDNVPYKEKSKRFIELTSALEEIIEEKSKNLIGKTLEVLVDGRSKTDSDMLSGYTESNKIVHFKGDESLVGQIVKVKITESHTYSLIGEFVDE